ncbi:MAG: hypothetical protein WEB53_06595 [Akkermansiaceae bacterium]
MKFLVCLGFWLLLTVDSSFANPIAIQPLGPVRAGLIQQVTAGIRNLYSLDVVVLPEKPLPKAAYYPPRKRYKAEDIIDVLAAESPPELAKIIALTSSDISATTDAGKDWGIMGLGQLGGRVCLVSTFRLRNSETTQKVFFARLIKVVNHELGHTFGVDHCTTLGCLMQDKRGKVASVDGETGDPCASCAKRLPLAK